MIMNSTPRPNIIDFTTNNNTSINNTSINTTSNTTNIINNSKYSW